MVRVRRAVERISRQGFPMVTTPRSADRLILIVEDDEVMTDTYARGLRFEGYEVRIALSGEAGLREVQSNAPDAIIVDLHMPDIDGLEFLRRLRARNDKAKTPVAIVTGGYLDDTISTQLLELGAEVRFKPLWLDDLVSLVHKLLEPAS